MCVKSAERALFKVVRRAKTALLMAAHSSAAPALLRALSVERNR